VDFSKIDLNDHQDLARTIVLEGVQKTFKDRSTFQKFRNRIIKRENGRIFHNLYFVKAYEDLVKEGKIEANEEFLRLIQKRRIRTMSGVAPVTVLTKPFPCPGKCTYCPTDVRMPKSYLISQPAAQRGFRQRFDPYSQVYVRLKALEMTGHQVSKVELRILGGTWSSYPKGYQTWFVKRCLQAMNEYKEVRSKNEKGKKDLEEQVGLGDSFGKLGMTSAERTVKNRIETRRGVDEVNTLEVRSLEGGRLKFDDVVEENETAAVRCIGINVETRPDWVDAAEIKRLRRLGVTKVEIGVQTTDDKVQELTRRGHDLEAVRVATKLFKDAGFKLSYHMMPNLEGTTVERDKKMVGELFSDDRYQPDYLKIYPCVVIPRTSLSVRYRKGLYEPYDDKTLFDVLYENMKSVPEYCRIDRVARDIPSNEIEAGSKVSNVRQMLEKKLLEDGTPCRDIRYREIGETEFRMENVEFRIREYRASGGTEMFLSYEDSKQDKLIALLRLRFPDGSRGSRVKSREGVSSKGQVSRFKREVPDSKFLILNSKEKDEDKGVRLRIKELEQAALVREVHVYGRQISVGKKGSKKQHVGWGTKLMADVERLAKKAGYKKIAVIAGIGTREYYKKFGYKLEGTYMVKMLEARS
jgi:elongator complex protein 3